MDLTLSVAKDGGEDPTNMSSARSQGVDVSTRIGESVNFGIDTDPEGLSSLCEAILDAITAIVCQRAAHFCGILESDNSMSLKTSSSNTSSVKQYSEEEVDTPEYSQHSPQMFQDNGNGPEVPEDDEDGAEIHDEAQGEMAHERHQADLGSQHSTSICADVTPSDAQ